VIRTPLSRSKDQRSRSSGRFTHRGLKASGSCSGERGNVLAVGNYCYVAVCSAALGASAPTEGAEGRGHVAAAARLQLVYLGRSAYSRNECRRMVAARSNRSGIVVSKRRLKDTVPVIHFPRACHQCFMRATCHIFELDRIRVCATLTRAAGAYTKCDRENNSGAMIQSQQKNADGDVNGSSLHLPSSAWQLHVTESTQSGIGPRHRETEAVVTITTRLRFHCNSTALRPVV